MRLLTFLRLMREIRRKNKTDIDRIQKMGLLAVKLSQIFALRPDILPPQKCRDLQALYQNANTIPPEDSMKRLKEMAPPYFFEEVQEIDEQPFAAASIGQVHRARLKDGSRVVIKIIKSNFEKKFRRDVKRLRRWLKIGLFFRPKLRKVGNPLELLTHVENYTLRELDLRNEIKGSEILQKLAEEKSHTFPLTKLTFPKVWPKLSNSHILVMEEITAPTLEDLLAEGQLEWNDLLELFRIHGAFMFGMGTFHGDLHPGNVMLRDNGTFVFIDTGAICTAPEHVRSALFSFFFYLAKGELKKSFESMLHMAKEVPSPEVKKRYMDQMHELYDGFVGTSVSTISLTQQMMKTVKASVLAGCEFGEESFAIIRALMYMDGMVLRGHPNVDLIYSMGPYLDEFEKISPVLV